MTEPANQIQSPAQRKTSRARLLIELLTFQLKLLIDGMRDVILIPVAFVAAVLGVLFGGDQPDHYFRRLMRFGQKTDRFINLFGQHDQDTDSSAQSANSSPLENGLTADELLAPYQQRLLERVDGTDLDRKPD